VVGFGEWEGGWVAGGGGRGRVVGSREVGVGCASVDSNQLKP